MNIRKEISRLRKLKQQWLKETYTANAVKEKFGLRESDIEKIEPTEKYGLKRYAKENIAQFLKTQESKL